MACRPSLQSAVGAYENVALDRPPVSKYDVSFLLFLTSGDLDLQPFDLKICTALTRAVEVAFKKPRFFRFC